MYHLLPFRFSRIDDYEVLISELGNYLVVPQGTIQLIVNHSLPSDNPFYKDLVVGNFISEEAFPSLINNQAVRLRTKKAFLDNFTSLHIIVLTLRCNQNCTYCQASSRPKYEQGYDISITNLKKSIDLIFQSPSLSVTIEFQGGESSLVPELIYTAVDYSKLKNTLIHKEITYVLCTNSIELSEDLINYCKENNIYISTSFDGPEFLHNNNRGKNNSYNKFLSGIEKLRKIIGNEFISALMTTSIESLDYPYEIVNSYIQNGFNRIFLRPLNPYGLIRDSIDWDTYFKDFVCFYIRALDYIIELNIKGISIVEDFATIILRKILTPYSDGFVDLQSPAGIINSVVVYNYNGKIYASDESRMIAEYGDDKFCLGTVNDDYNSLFYGKLTQSMAKLWCTEYIAGCSDCAFQSYCGADPVRNYVTQQDPYGFRPTSQLCLVHKSIIEHLFRLLIYRKSEVFPIFQSWIVGEKIC